MAQAQRRLLAARDAWDVARVADAEARVGAKGPPSDQCMSSLVNMLTAMQGVGPPGMGGSGAAPAQPSAA